jgi:radical SAM superfamily enzyme YgiQ (UPF0313 family)
MFMTNVFEIGPIRPPSEANSLLLRVTENCPWNKCKFCMLYKEASFHTRTVEEVKADIDAMAYYRDRILKHKDGDDFRRDALLAEYHSLATEEERYCYQMVFHWMTEGQSHSIFLQDANTMVLRADRLAEIISYIRVKLPEIKRVTSYGRADTLSRITKEDYQRLRKAGLDRIHSGFESGSDKVLTLIGKGTTQQQQIDGGRKVREAGIELSIYFMPGAGGKEFSEDNALETAKVICAVNPDFVRLRTFVVKNGSFMWDMKEKGEFVECSDIEKLKEIRLMISNIKNCTGTLASDHIINLLERVNGNLGKDIPALLEYIDEFLNLPPLVQKQYQLARRMGFAGDWKDMNRLHPSDLSRIKQVSESITDAQEWEIMLNRYMDRYI